MGDLVNDYFKQFYPATLDEAKFRYSSMLGGMRAYEGDGGRVFPPMTCADGFHMSVQGHYGAYCSPRDDFARRYASVEVGFPSEREELLMPYVEDADKPTDTVYGYVPVEIIEQVVAKHGGLVARTQPQDTPTNG